MTQMLSKMCAYDQENWPKYLPTIVMEYNASRNASTGETPFFMMFGRDFRFPEEIKNGTGIGKDTVWNRSGFSYIAKRLAEEKGLIPDMSRMLRFIIKREFHTDWLLVTWLKKLS